MSAYLIGGELSETDARDLERDLEAFPESVRIRIKLMGYYALHRWFSEAITSKFAQTILWLITNHPMNAIHSLLLVRSEDPVYEEAMERWNEQIKAHEGNATILRNALRLSIHAGDYTTAETLLINLMKSNQRDPDLLYESYRVYKHLGESKNDKIALSRSLKHLQLAFENAESENKFVYLTSLPSAALVADKPQLAERYCSDLIKMSRSFEESWNFGNALHQAFTVLGLIALSKDDVGTAKEYLQKSNDVPPTPQLSSFVGELTLAKKLLALGEREAVVSYLLQSKKLLGPAGDIASQYGLDERVNELSIPNVIDRWISEIRNNGVPELWKETTST